jgi:diacylglycerol kinase (ATP)
VNPAAGNGSAAGAGRRVGERLRRRGASFETAATKGPGHAGEIAREFLAAEPDGLLLVVGGDGTLHEALPAYAASPGRGVLAFVPAGGGNDAARTIGLPGGIARAVDVALQGREIRLDLGLLGSEPFFNGVGVGLDGDAAARVQGFRRLTGLPAYLVAALQAIAAFEKPRLRLEDGGEVLWEGPALLCAVGNGRSCGGGFLLTPDAVPDDGTLDACVLGDFGKLEALANLPRALSGAHRSHRKARFFRRTRFRLSADRPLVAHADGEIRRPRFPIDYSVLPGAVRVMAP